MVEFIAHWSRRSALVVGLVIAAGSAQAQVEIPGYGTIDDYDPREVAMLPRFCPFTALFNEKVPAAKNVEEGARWRELFGPSYYHLHHYCWGLMKTNRGVLLARSEDGRMFYLRESIKEFDYVINRVPDEFILLPEILTKKGQNLIRIGKGPAAVMVFDRAARLKPDYWPPYAYVSDYFKELGDKARAREYLEQGLANSPDTPALKRRLEELDPPSARAKPSAQAKHSP